MCFFSVLMSSLNVATVFLNAKTVLDLIFIFDRLPTLKFCFNDVVSRTTATSFATTFRPRQIK